jgi:hypothetical protein
VGLVRTASWARRVPLVLAVLAAAAALAGCGSGSGVNTPTVTPAKVYSLAGFEPAKPVAAGVRTTISFTIRQPSGRTLTAYKKCCAPHDGVDLIIVRSDDSHVQYDDSDISPSGRVTQPVVFPVPGRYRIVVDTYPQQKSATSPFNFQLFTWVTVKGPYHAQPLPAYQQSQTVDGYHFQIQGTPHLRAIQAGFLTVKVQAPDGGNAAFTSWRGALAHAIFIHKGSLDYFHTHVCSPGAAYCTSVLGKAKVTGTSNSPGVLKVGILLPEPGTWRLFLLTYIGGRHITVPFTLNVA